MEGLEVKKSKFSEDQMAYAVRQGEQGVPVTEICRKLGITAQTFYRWRKKFGGLEPSEIKRLKQLEDENLRLKRLVGDLSLDKQVLQDALRKKP